MKRIAFLTVVVLVAFAGVAYAAGSITGKSIKDGSITGKDIKNKSLTAKDFKGSVRGPRGFTGDRGPQGVVGPPGPAGALGLQVVEATMVVQPGDVDGPQAFCPAGKSVIGTGFYAGVTDVGFVEAFGGSAGAGYINNSSIPVETKVQAICAGGGAVAAAASRTSARRAFQHRLASLVPVAHATCTRARILGKSKCIARGQFCTHSRRANRDYHRYSLHCGKRDRNGNYHLVYH